MRAALALGLLIGCTHAPPVERIATPPAGISMAFYRAGTAAFAVVDDRRWVEVRGGQLVLDHIDPGAALPSLVIEPLAGPALSVGQCDRDHETRALPKEGALERYGTWQAEKRRRILEGDASAADAAPPGDTLTVVSPVVRCTAASGGDGRRLVRVLYVSSALAYTAQHTVEMTSADRATIATRFAIATPSWGGRADAVLFEGVPGGDKPPVELARGALILDGSTAVLGAAPRQAPARVRRVFDGATRTGVGDSADPSWGRDSVHAVWVWLELDGVTLSPGATRAHVEIPGETVRDIDVPAAGREHTAAGTRLPLWIDEELRGLRSRSVTNADGASLADRLTFSVSNVGTEPREVWVEERLRTAKRVTLKTGWPVKPALTDEVARTKVLVKGGGTERLGFVIEYVF